jgi:hypothetical protein
MHMATKINISASVVLANLLIFQCAMAIASDSAETLENSPTKVSFKLTPSYYKASDGKDAADINIRANTDKHTVWLGEYRDKNGYHQSRAGYEYKFDIGFTRSVISAQLASGGFIGGSVTTEIGGDTFGILGFGRTNLHDYYNLNFDPNDAITIGIGTRAFNNTELSLFQVRDDRLGTGQYITHLLWRYKTAEAQRLSVDTSYKNGLNADNIFVHGYGLSAEYDYHQYFARIARDQHANFTGSNLTRLSLGLRF